MSILFGLTEVLLHVHVRSRFPRSAPGQHFWSCGQFLRAAEGVVSLVMLTRPGYTYARTRTVSEVLLHVHVRTPPEGASFSLRVLTRGFPGAEVHVSGADPALGAVQETALGVPRHCCCGSCCWWWCRCGCFCVRSMDKSGRGQARQSKTGQR